MEDVSNRIPWGRQQGQGWSALRLRCPMCMRLTKDGVIADCDAGLEIVVQERTLGSRWGWDYYLLEMDRYQLRQAKAWMIGRLQDAIERVNSSFERTPVMR